MKTRTKTYYFIYLAFLVVVLAGIIFGSFYDFKITSSLYDPSSNFGMIFASFGEMPSWILVGLLGVMGVKLFKLTEQKVQKVLFLIAGILLAIISAYRIFNSMDSQFNGLNWPVYVKIIVAILIEAVIFALGYKLINTEDKIMLLKISLLFITAFLLQTIILLIIKTFWQRPRYRLIYAGYESYTALDLFRNWYEPGAGLARSLFTNVHKDQFMSFPSGHTAGSMIGVLFFYLPLLNKKTVNSAKTRYIFLIVAFCFSAVVAFSRLVYGCHYLTDVSFGALLALTCSFVTPYFILKEGKNVKVSEDKSL